MVSAPNNHHDLRNAKPSVSDVKSEVKVFHGCLPSGASCHTQEAA